MPGIAAASWYGAAPTYSGNPADQMVLWVPRRTPTASTPVLIALPGHGFTGASEFQESPYTTDTVHFTNNLVAQLADWGRPAYSIDCGGSPAWRADTQIVPAINAVMADAHSRWGSTVFGIFGHSMGGYRALSALVLGTLSYAPAAVAMFAGLADLSYAHSLFTAEVETACGGASWFANSAGYDPIRNASVLAARSTKLHLWHGDADATLPLSYSRALSSAMTGAGATNFALDVIAGADHLSIFNAVPADAVARFLLANNC